VKLYRPEKPIEVEGFGMRTNFVEGMHDVTDIGRDSAGFVHVTLRSRDATAEVAETHRGVLVVAAKLEQSKPDAPKPTAPKPPAPSPGPTKAQKRKP
jgi:hypothetical protein